MSSMRSRILVVDDEKMVRWGLRQALEEAGYEVDEADSAARALEVVNRETPDVVLLDYRLPDENGIVVLKHLRQHAPRVPAVMITAHASIGGAVEAMKEGAYDYVSKPFEVDEVIQTVARALEAGKLREEVAHQREEELRDYRGRNIVARSPSMQEIMRLIKKVATSEASTILLLGDSGVGKGQVARALHYEGHAWEKPFMHITCTALPEALLESELFGHEKGAFTDARSQKKGLFELAEGGTVFLDEIGDLPPAVQGKLLRFLEDKAFRRVGGTRDIHVSVRIIAATNKRLENEVESGRFRQDLYFRLKVIPIEIPPLRERPEDLLPLVTAFIAHFNHEFGKSVKGIEPDAVRLMQGYGWPGNVRELRNAIERAVLLSESEWLERTDLPSELRARSGVGDPGGRTAGGFALPASGVVLEDLERELLVQALTRANGNRTRAARLLGLNRDQIRYRIRKFDLKEFALETD